MNTHLHRPGGSTGNKLRLLVAAIALLLLPFAATAQTPTASMPVAGTSGTLSIPSGYPSNSAATVVDNGITLYSQNYTGFTVSIASGGVTSDVLSYSAAALPSGVTGSYSSSTQTLTFSGSTAGASAYQTLLRTVTITSSAASSTNKSVRFNVGTLASYNGHYYQIVNNGGLTWSQSISDAASRTFYGLQGYLATITSAAENNFITPMLNSSAWISGYTPNSSFPRYFYWAAGPENNGTSFCYNYSSGGYTVQNGLYANWQGGEPNNAGGETVAEIYAGSGTWNDATTSTTVTSYVVEYGGLSSDPAVTLYSTRNITYAPGCTTPAAFSVTGGGGYCTGGSAIAIGLSGSATGVNYQLKLNGANTGSVVAGTGSALAFPAQTAAGTYTVTAADAATGSCTATMTGSATITTYPQPQGSLTANGPFCVTGTGQLTFTATAGTSPFTVVYNDGTANRTATGIASGTAFAPFTNPVTGTTTYTLVSVQGVNCTRTTGFTGSAATITVNPAPAIYNVTGGGAYCSGGAGTPVGLDNSQSGVSYQLQLGGTNTGSPVAGTGSAISFGNQTAAGTYTVSATATAGGCTSTMSGSATISINPLPQGSLTANGPFCGTGAGQLSFTATAGTAPFTVVYNDGVTNRTATGVASGTPFNVFTSPVTATTTYTLVSVQGVNCTRAAGFTGGAATITVNPTPDAVATPSTQTICSGDAIATIALTGSVSGTTYSWVMGANANVSGIAASGTGDISGSLTNSGNTPQTVTFTITPSTSSCTGAATTATVTVNPTPTVNTVSNQTLCAGNSTAAVMFSGAVANTIYNWTNNTPSIGLAAGGTGNINSFTATNTTNTPVTATVTVTPVTGASGTQTFNYTGAAQNWTVPAGVTSVQINTSGASGGTSAAYSGKGGSAQGTLAVTPGQILKVYVGGLPAGMTGGYNGGGAGVCNATGGGGGSDVRVSPYTLADRIIVAGGGGGDYQGLYGGGAGGGLTGGSASPGNNGNGTQVTGGTQSAPGNVSTGAGLGQGANSTNYCGGGGGGGYYGGGATGSSTPVNTGGAGGSSYIGGVTAATTTSGTNSGSGIVTISYLVPPICTGPSKTFTITVNPLPTVYTVTGGGSYCAGGTGVPVGLSSSQSGVSYQLQLGGTNTGSPVAGTGSAISFGTQAAAGTYTVLATATVGSCSSTMSGSAMVTANPLPVFTSCPSSAVTASTTSNSCAATVTYTSTATNAASYSYAFSGATTGSGNGTGSGSVFNSGNTVVVVTATTANSCTATCSFVVTVTDNTPPTVVSLPTNISVSNDAGMCSAIVTWTAPTAADNCTGVTITQTAGPASGAAFTVGGPVTITYVATDAANNTSGPQSFTVTVTDAEHPIFAFVPQNSTVNCQDATTVAALGTATATDNCGVQSVASSDMSTQGFFVNSANYYNYTITRTWTATDVHNLTTTATQVITVQDVTAPTLTAPAPVAQCNNGAGNNITRTATATDACSSPLAYSWTITGATTGSGAGAAATANFNVGTSTISWTVSDVSGNTSSPATSTVTINPLPAVSFTNTQPLCNGSCNGSITANPAGGQAPYNYLWTQGSSATTATISNICANTYTVQVTDNNGCQASGSDILSQPAALVAGTVSATNGVPSCPAYNIYIGYGPQSSSLSVAPSGGTAPYSYSWSPAAGVSNIHANPASISATATTIYNVAVTDAHGCAAAPAAYTVKVKNVHCGPTYVGRELNTTVSMCHNNATVCVSLATAAGYIAGGDCFGTCGAFRPGSGGADGNTGIEGVTGGTITVYPNPAHTEINVALKDMGGVWKGYQVIDLTGRLVATRYLDDALVQDVVTVDVSALVPGVYLIKIIGEEGINAVARFSVQ